MDLPIENEIRSLIHLVLRLLSLIYQEGRKSNMVLLILTYDGDREDNNIHGDYYQDKFYLLIYQYFSAIFVGVI